MLREIHHVGIAVPDLETARELYEGRLGMTVEGPFEVPEQGVRVLVARAGEDRIELLAPLNGGGPVARFLEKRGPGVHHIAYRVEEIETAHAALVARGLEPIDPEPRRGLHGWRVAFFHPRSALGVLIELVEE